MEIHIIPNQRDFKKDKTPSEKLNTSKILCIHNSTIPKKVNTLQKSRFKKFTIFKFCSMDDKVRGSMLLRK